MTARTYISEGANVKTSDSVGRTPLFLAASNSYKIVVKLLLETRRVDVNSGAPYSLTPLSTAASKAHAPVVKLFLATGQSEC